MKPVATRLPRLLSVRAIAEQTTLPLSSIYDLISRGELPALRLGEKGRGVRVCEQDVLGLLVRRRESST
ncbi:MAG: helix-turn-helix transcriptional regulator [Thermoanaerobaculia bacterium]